MLGGTTLLLKNITYLTPEMKFETGNIEIIDGKLNINSKSGRKGIEFHCEDYLVVPGLINAHFHSYSSCAKGLGKEIEIQNWCAETEQGRMQQQLFNYLDNQSTEEEFRIICQKSYIEMVRQGVTFVSDSDPGHSPYSLSEAINEVGIRGIVDTHSKVSEYVEKRNKNVMFGSHLLEEEDMTEETLMECVNQKEKYDMIKMTHCLENNWRNEIVQSNFGKSSVELYQEKNLLDEKTVLFHGVYMSSEDIQLISKAKASVVHCPISNMWSGAGVANVKEMLDQKINVCLGTDYSHTDMWEVMRMAYYLLKLNTTVNHFNAEDIFKMATMNGAKAYQLENEIGQISNGYKADLVFIKKDNSLYPLINQGDFSTYAHNLLTNCKSELIEHVMVNGKWVLKDKELQTMNEQKVNIEYMKIMDKIYNK